MRWWALAIVCACGIAHADPQGDAAAHLERGKHLYEIQDYDGAIAEYQAGYLITQRAEFLYGIGQAYRMKGDCDRALRSYDAVLRAPDGEPLAEAARQNMARCHATEPPPPPPPPPAVREHALPWYRDTLGDAIVIGGVAAIAGGATMWKIGRDEADRTYDAMTYDAWSASMQDARHADAFQRIGIAAISIGAVAIVAGVVHYITRAER